MTTPDKIQPELDELQKQNSEIRNLIAIGYRQFISKDHEEGCYRKICAGMDYNRDISRGLESYLKRDDSFDKEQNDYLYVEIIGVLNCLQVQQNVVREMYNLITGKDIDLKKEYEGIKEIRTTRNAIAGHPLDSGGDAHFITYHSLSKWGFEHHSYPINTMQMKSESVDLASFLYQHTKSLNHVLKRIIDYMETKYKEHKKKFKNEKLADIFLQRSYLSAKISEDHELNDMHIKEIEGMLEKFESALLKRDKKLSGENFICHDIPLIKHALSKYLSFSTVDDDCYIYAYFIGKELKKLEIIAEETDKEYSL